MKNDTPRTIILAALAASLLFPLQSVRADSSPSGPIAVALGGGAGTIMLDYTVDSASPAASVSKPATAVRAAYSAASHASYKVVFNANGGKGKMAAQSFSYGVSKKLSANRFTKKGRVFAGWSLKKGSAVAFADKATVKNLSSKGEKVTLYAVWAKPNYKVAFYANGGKGKMSDQKMAYGKAKKLSANKFKREGYAFKGWATSKANAKKGKVAYKNKKKVKNLVTTGKTVKLYAVWKKK